MTGSPSTLKTPPLLKRVGRLERLGLLRWARRVCEAVGEQGDGFALLKAHAVALDARIGSIGIDTALRTLSEMRTPEDPSLPQRLSAGLRWIRGDREMAINELRAISGRHEDPAANCQLGSMLACSGQVDAAVECFATAAAFDARYPCANHRPAAYEAARLNDPEAARKLLRARPPLERLALLLLTSPGQRILSVAAVIGTLFPLIAEEGSLLVTLAPAIVAAGLWLTTGAALPDWRRLAFGFSVIPAAVATDLMEESGVWARGVDAIVGLVLMVVWLIVCRGPQSEAPRLAKRPVERIGLMNNAWGVTAWANTAVTMPTSARTGYGADVSTDRRTAR